MKNAFTMIELIFALIIIGILGAVAVPRYFGIEQQARENISKSFAATMTRTVGHSLWSKSLSEGKDGSIKDDNDGNASTFYERSLEVYVSIPDYFDKTTVNFENCVQSGAEAKPFMKKSEKGKYNLFCRDGNATDAPLFVLDEGETHQF
ncbi:type II secretion system protein [Nitratiruptor sp. SB155-2]|uniref:type II secretion system protein n=1 Tax=Nitratiruptor sp. (strain SB155-2) TaxID=387092 RepID=UPI0001586E3A|nr:prepilin-type N-terminal cleavage/methylation domain-containing protein [Nitratiruptor sp. SB155-2]BAF69448.1 conserved hypothetical protein [Nitratiruptor sp. SB155-2]